MINTNKIEATKRLECSADTKLFFDDVYKSGIRGKKQQVETIQSERSILSKCAGYTQYFLSDVYTNSTRTKKAQVETVQCGRSMIEMLGVLAIVGVLSVGGIAGYSKAMEKFKINKTIEQMSQIITNIRTLYAQQTTYDGLIMEGSSGNVLDMDIIPDSLITSNSWPYIRNNFGGPVHIQRKYGEKAFYISFGQMPNEACLSIASLDWGSQDGIVGIAVGHGYISYASKFDSLLIENCSDGNYSSRSDASNAGIYSCSSSISVAKIASQIPNWAQYDNDYIYGCHVTLKVK